MNKYLKNTDSIISKLVDKESKRQDDTLMLIPSENYSSSAVKEALGSSLSNKYAEGYPEKRYYQGQKFVDQIESIAQERAKKLFKVPHANIQPYSGSPANTAVYFALLNPGETIMGLELSSGGHLTHGRPKITLSGKYFNSVQYQVGKEGFIDFEEIEMLANRHKPKIIIAGTTAYSRTLDFHKFAQIADSVEAYLLADISHISGLVVAGVHPSPAKHAHIITTTTHKTLRGPRGALIMTTDKGIQKDSELSKKIDKAVFPGTQGGPHIHTIAGIAVALKEASTPSFRTYANQIIKNAKTLSQSLIDNKIDIVTGGTDNHLMVADLRPIRIPGKEGAILLEEAGIVVNYNTIPHDPHPPFNPSGIRLGTPAITSRGMKEKEAKQIGQLIADTLTKKQTPKQVKAKVKKLCEKFPIPKEY